jgi:hypothetical protein
VQLGTPGAATWDVSISGTVVNLATVNAGNPASLNAWFTDKALASPTFAGTALASGDQIWIIKGTYYLTGSVGFKGGVKMYGGFAGTAGETVATRAKSSTDAWDFTNVTAFDGSVGGVKTYIGISGGSGTSGTLIDGFTIQNCHNAATSSSGGAAKITSTGTTLQNCIITNCTSATGSTGACAGVYVGAGGTLKDSYVNGPASTLTGTSKLSGCKIANTTASAVYLYGGASGAIIENCNFLNNSSASNGGAITCYMNNTTNTAAISITGCTFTSNTAKNGGAIYPAFSGTTSNKTFNITGCTFSNNSATNTASSTNGGGAINAGLCTLNIDKCIFTNNTATISGGGAVLLNSTSITGTVISNCIFKGNTVASYGGSAISSKAAYTAKNCLFADNGDGIFTFYTATLASTFQNCTFANNLTSGGDPTSINLVNLTPKYEFTNCLFYKISSFTGQTPTLTNCAFDMAVPSEATNSLTGLSTDDFVDATNATITSRDYRLATGSRAIDAGTDLSTATSPVTKDILYVNRPQGSAFDMGAYEYTGTNLTFETKTSMSKTYGDAAFTNAATSQSTVTISYTSGNEAVATVNGSTGEVTIVAAGTAVITANIAADGTFGAATVSYTLTVNTATPNLVFATPTEVSKVDIDEPFINAATSNNSAGEITYASSNEAVATVNASNGEVTIVSVGTAVITASIAANGNYSASSVSYTLTISNDITGLSVRNTINPISIIQSRIVSNINGTIQIHNLSGELVFSANIKSAEMIVIPIGMYIVKVISNKDVFIQKVVIK